LKPLILTSKINIPNILTWLRIGAIPLFIAVLYIDESWLTQRQINVTAWAIFVAAAITAFLDPVADKLMVAAALIMLVQLKRVDAMVAIIIIGREITISALREWMAQVGQSKSVAVSMIGKVKTVAQLVAIPFLLWHDMFLGFINCQIVGTYLIWGAAALTIWSMFYYLKAAFASPPT
jgi:cardiolipin synthase (CMP-forming)